ncbi:myosin heavy chain, muscle-like [Onthophagus taurus]|uniref:myosin heavy chain, muscle-like n=1 Tax=Onthophagus taurus TaxID=166361 RepID=UPI0039BE0FB9
MLNFVLSLLIITSFVDSNPMSPQDLLEKIKPNFEMAENATQNQPELSDAHEKINDLSIAIASMSAAEKKLKTELQTLHSNLDELLNEAKNSEEKAKKAMVDSSRLADELRAEQDHAQTQEKLQKALANQIKNLQLRVEEVEAKLEQRRLAKCN